MRGMLAVAAVAAAAAAPAAVAFPPECDKYSDKPCYTVREGMCDADRILAPLFEPLPLPGDPGCGSD